MEVGEFFNKNHDFYNQNLLKYDYEFMEFIKNENNHEFSVLDIGGGNGNFSKLLIQNCPDVNITILDPSEILLNRINNPKISKIIGKLPDDIPLNSKFDFIHIKEVIHHITGNTVFESKSIVKKSLNILKTLLNDNGIILIHEIYYEGLLIPEFPNYLIFYLLKFQNMLNVKIPIKEFILGLYIYFYTRKELETMLNECGLQIMDCKVEKFSNNIQKKFMLLKDWGRILIIAKLSEDEK